MPAATALARVADRLTACRHGREGRTGYTLDVDATIIAADKQDATRAHRLSADGGLPPRSAADRDLSLRKSPSNLLDNNLRES